MDKLLRYCLRFCSLVVLLAACLMPFSAYADEAVTEGTLVDIVLRNPADLEDWCWKVSGTIDSNISSNSYTQTFDTNQFVDQEYVIVDYVLTLPFSIPANTVGNIAWIVQGSVAGANLSQHYPYDVPVTSKYRFYWGEAERLEVVVGEEVTVAYQNPVPVVLNGNTDWLQINTEEVPFPNGVSNSFTFRFWFPTETIRTTAGATFKDFLNSSAVTYSTMSCSALLPSSDLVISYREVDQTVGMLEGIIEWLKGILDNIIQLPQKIWSHVENGLKGLFVPDAEFMESYKAEWDSVLQDSMGGVYQSVSMIDEFYESFKVSSTQGTIRFPEVNVPVAGETFTFGGYDVDIVPDEAPFLKVVIDGIKLVMNAVCTLAVLQSFKRRYERVVSE